MKTKYGIGLFILISVVLYLSFYTSSGSELITESEKNPEKNNYEQSIETDGNASKEDFYYLVELNGYIIVLESDKRTLYEYTDILIDELPDLLQKEIKNGKYIESKEILYGFLENYSS